MGVIKYTCDILRKLKKSYVAFVKSQSAYTPTSILIVTCRGRVKYSKIEIRLSTYKLIKRLNSDINIVYQVNIIWLTKLVSHSTPNAFGVTYNLRL